MSKFKNNFSLKTTNKKVGQKYTFNKKRPEESSRNVCSADLDDSLGKEELYLSKGIIYDVWDYYYSSSYEIMFIQLYWIIKTNYICKYTFLWKKQEAT